LPVREQGFMVRRRRRQQVPAHDKATGEILAEIELPANQSGVPMTYSINGKQYIVLAVGQRIIRESWWR